MTHCSLPGALLETAVQETRPEMMKRISALRPHAVILHKDEYHHDRLDYVGTALTNVVGVLSSEDAMEIAQTAFRIGRAVVITCPKETAEYYKERLVACGLNVTVEEVV